MLMNQSFFRGGTEDRCRHLPRTIVLEAMQSSAPSNGAAPAAVAKKVATMVTIPNCQGKQNITTVNSASNFKFHRFTVIYNVHPNFVPQDLFPVSSAP